MLNEINRSPNPEVRTTSRNFASQFHTLPYKQDEFDDINSRLNPYLPANPTEQDKSDLAHLAKAISANAKFYVTRDGAVLSHADKIYDEFGILILRPADLIIEIDSLHREREYQPARLAGTLYEICKVQIQQEDMLVKRFQNQLAGEKQINLKDKLRRALSLPHEIESMVAWTHQKQPIGLLAYTRTNTDALEVSLFRTAEHPLSPSIARFLVSHIIKIALSKKCLVIQVSDPYLDGETEDALTEDHFVLTDTTRTKLSLPFHSKIDDVLALLAELGKKYSHIEQHCKKIQKAISYPNTCADLPTIWETEDSLWPLKIMDSNIPCYIVPIKPQWALHLFDEHLANQDIFGAKIDLGLNREGVYYRAKLNASGLSAPARLLWYVSESKRHPGSGCIRAHSRLDEVLLGTPKSLFRQFRRLGIYEWKDVYATAKNDIDKQIMALRFCKTEMLDNPYPWEKIIQQLAEAGIKTQLQSPCKIPAKLFFSITSSN
jgi:hypothetical protein